MQLLLSSPASWGKLQKWMSGPCGLSLVLLQWMPTLQKYLLLSFFFFHPYSTALFDVLSKALMWHCIVSYSALSAAFLAPKQCCVLVVKHDFMTRLASCACLGRHQWPGAILLSTLLGIYSLLFTRAFDVAPSLPSNFCAAALSRVLWWDWQALVSTASTSMSSCSKLLQQRNTRTSTEIN